MTGAPCWKPLFDRSVAAFYEGDLATGRLACDRLLGLPDLPDEARETTRRNAVHYARPIAELAPGWTARRLTVPLDDGWAALNPAFVPVREDGRFDDAGPIRVLVRVANFRLDPPASYAVADGGGVVRSRYYLLDLDASLSPRGDARPLRDRTPDDGLLDPLVRDNEDLRPIRVGDRWCATGQTWRRTPDGRRTVRTALFDLDPGSSPAGAIPVSNPTLANLRWLSRGAEGIHEKNWMPVASAGRLAFVYACAPTVVLGCDPASGSLDLRAVHDAPLLARSFRGGSPLLPTTDGFLALVHEVAFWETGARTYLHRLVRFDDRLRIAAVSHPFRFHGENVEFALGLARRGDRLLVAYGVMDREAWIASVPAAELESLLLPVAHLAPGGTQPLPMPRGARLVLGAPGDPAHPDPVGGFGSVAPDAAAPTPVDSANAGEARTGVETIAHGVTPVETVADGAAPTDAGGGMAGFTPVPADPAGGGGAGNRGISAIGGNPATVRGDAGPDRGGAPFLVSMTLSGNARDCIADGLRSVVDWVDCCLVIDTGISDDTLDIARAVAGDKLLVRSFPWRDDFAAARNAALDFAAETGAAWSLFVDTDERIERRGADPRAFLAAAEHDAVFVAAADGSYQKERFFRLPRRDAYVGPTHECWIGGSRGVMPGAAFRELGKDDAGIRRKLERDLAILRRHTAAHPEDPRWWYYLGDTLANLRQPEEGIVAFERCLALDGWDEESGWAAYRIARLLGDDLKRWAEAEAACARGLTRHPAMVELYWAAGYCAYWGGRPQRAAHWARAAIALNESAASGFIPERGGFKYVPASWEAPWDVLRHALRAIGDGDGAANAERMHAATMEAREAGLAYPARNPAVASDFPETVAGGPAMPADAPVSCR